MTRRPHILRLLAPVSPAAFFAFSLSCLFGCSDSETTLSPQRSCETTVWHLPASANARVEIVGDFNDWKRPGVIPDRAGDWRVANIAFPPGEQRYLIYENGTAMTDRNVGTTAYWNGAETSWIDVGDCQVPSLTIDRVHATEDGRASIDATFLAAKGGSPLLVADVHAIAPRGRVTSLSADAKTGKVHVALEEMPRGKTFVSLQAKSEDGLSTPEARASIWVENRAYDPRDTVLYQVVVDRFRGDTGSLAAPKTLASRAGGTLRGVTQAVVDGTFAAMSVNTLWISPAYQNPEGEFLGTDGRTYSSYHQYWPTDPYAVDSRLGGEAALDELLEQAHARGIRVLFDVVPNHVHQEHPYAKTSAFTDGSSTCICGIGSCDWATNIDTCWFAPYLPDLNWKDATLARKATADTVWWLDRFGADGFRIDAVPMTPRSATRRIAHLARTRFEHPGNPLLLLGENFTGPGAYELLRRDLGRFGLNGTFHFPLMWTLRSAIANESVPLSAIDDAMHESDDAWGTSGAVMGLMIGNHDVSRFASSSAGTEAGSTWEPAPQRADPLVFEKQQFAFATLFSLPGAPVIYYGDEVALAGKSDPDCRRVMPSEAELSDAQKGLRESVGKLARLRACSTALRRGKFVSHVAEADLLVFSRELEGNKRVLVVLARKDTRLDLGTPRLPRGTYRDLFSGASIAIGESGTLALKAHTAMWLTNDDDHCPESGTP